MKILLNNNDLIEALHKSTNLGLVPTMGSLHKGHLSLIKRSLKDCAKTIVTIFVNPRQFNDKLDYKRYPRNLKKDLLILKKEKIDYVFLPSIKDIYKPKSENNLNIRLTNKDKILCARYRKGHFEGVLDVMDRFTKLIKPKKIFMGEKDFQQFFLVKRFIEKKYNSKVIACRTVRDKDKVALSSRNKLLNKFELNKAKMIAKNIIAFKKKITQNKNIKKIIQIKKREIKEKFKIDIEYFELRNVKNLKISNKIKGSKIFIAYNINKVRLIDNF